MDRTRGHDTGDHEHEFEFLAPIRTHTLYEWKNKGPGEIGNHEHEFKFPTTIRPLTAY